MPGINLILNNLKSGLDLFYQIPRALITIEGEDARTFLQRMSTNDLNNLTKSKPIQSSFTDNKGKMIDHCVIFSMTPSKFNLVSSHGDASVLCNWLEQYHFVEDFSLSKNHDQLPISMVITTANYEDDASCLSCWQGHLNDLIVNFYIMLRKPEGALAIDQKCFETLRIAALMPTSPNEINQTVMPHNIGLDRFIADNKGCYIGQEVIAKARVYQKRVKKLSGVTLTPEQFAKFDENIHTKDHALGTITSVAPYFVSHFMNALVLGYALVDDHVSSLY